LCHHNGGSEGISGMRRALRILHTVVALLVAGRLAVAEPGRRALLVGINTYKWSGAVHRDPGQDFYNLSGAAGDAIWLKSILTSKYGFRDQDVVVLTDAAATRQAIIDAFHSHLITKSAPGDVALFYFAGHGSRQGAGDSIENTLVPYDSRDPQGKVFDISSSEVHALFLALLEKTQNVTSILDSCYSDTTVRGGSQRRSIAPDARKIPGGAPGPGSGPVTMVVRISASRSDQESVEHTEYRPDGKTVQHGLMSYALFRELQAAGGQTTWRDVMDRTRTEVAKWNALQDPQMEAPSADTRIFGGAGLAAQEAFLLVSPQGQKVLLNAGSMHAIAKGTGLDVYPAGTHEFTGKPLAKLTVTNVADFTSEATVVSGVAARDIPDAARAVIRFRPATTFRFRIFFDGESPLLSMVRKAVLGAVPDAIQNPQRAGADAVVRFENGAFSTEQANGLMLSPAVPVAEDGAVDHVVRQLRQWARWRQLLMQEGSAPVLQLKVTDESGGSPPDVADGTTITVGLCNTGTQPYFTRVVYFSSDGAVTPLELETDAASLAAGQCRTGGSFVITVENGRKSAVEFFKAFATFDKIDFEPITEPGIRAVDSAQWSAVTKSLMVIKR
jgi:hypothetical protein